MSPLPIYLFLVTLFPLLAASQPYELEWRREAGIGGAGLLLLAADLGLSSALSPLDEPAISALKTEEVWGPDRISTRHFSLAADTRSHIALAGGLVVAGASGWLALGKKPVPGEGTVLGLIWMETNLLATGGTLAIKDAIRRVRPFVHNPEAPFHLKLEKDARRSFFSGHTSLVAANSFFAAKVFSDYFPESRWKPFVWGLAAALPAWTGVERVLAGKHFPSDVLAGYGFGALCGWLVPHLHKKEEVRLQVQPFSGNESAGLRLMLEL